MQHIHWLGTGLSSIPGIRKLAKNYDTLKIWNRTLEKAEQSINQVNKQNVVSKKFDINLYEKEILNELNQLQQIKEINFNDFVNFSYLY